MNLHDIILRLVVPDEELQVKALLQVHHDPGSAPPISPVVRC
jgi:hypothetical protein